MRKLILPTALLLTVLLLAAIPKPSGLHKASGIVPLLPAQPYPYDGFFMGFHFFEDSLLFSGSYDPGDNPITNLGATLGRVLFYDVTLSANKTISCASCHLPEFGFSDSARFSKGFNGEVTGRNSMGLANARMQPLQRFFWDATEDTLRHQVETALESLVEMGLDMDTMVSRLEASSFYPGLYADAFGDSTITPDRTFAAIGQFVRSMASFNSRYDIGAFINFDRHLDFPNFTQKENLGKSLFFSESVGCANCHTSHNFITESPFNTGLDQEYDDQGLGAHTGYPHDMALFKAPSLRNIELTAPYMHDGRFETLEQVVEHYNSGVQPHPNLSPFLRVNGDPNGQPKRLNLTAQEKDALVAFLKTLTDPYYLNDPRWQDPFAITQVEAIQLTPIDSLVMGIPLSFEQADLVRFTRVFPNPMTDHTTISFPNPDQERARVILHELSGRQVRNVVTKGRSVTLERGDLPSGTYLVRIHLPHDGYMTKILIE